jgi:hypothetical protein
MNQPEKRAADRRQKQQWSVNNKAKRYATVLVRRAIIKGNMIRPGKCEKCENTKRIHAHHEDYSKPLDVNWLCQECHGERHREINEKKRTG